MFQRVLAWFGRIPINDPVDRRNGVFMQWLLLFQGLYIPLNKLYLLLFNGAYLHDAFYNRARAGARLAISIDLGTDIAMTVAAWLGFWLIRKGHFRPGVSLYLVTVLASATLAYTVFGYQATDGNLTMIMVLALSGMMLGRRALWLTYAAEALIFSLSVIPKELFADPHATRVLSETYAAFPARALFGYLLLVIVFDRSIHALRQSLIESDAQRVALKREIAERERTREQLLHAQKMDAVGKLASGIAHDINNVLGIILGFATERDRLDDSDKLPDPDAQAMADALEGVELAARRGAAVCRKLLNFSRHDVTHAETFDAVGTLREIHPLLRQLLPPSIQLSIHTPARELPIHFDRSEFELALLNLASNARDAMPDGGRCSISLDATGESMVRLSVSDSGTGMSEQVRQQIFEPFFTTKSVDKGTGLGLSVVCNLIHRADGRIHVESTPGAGSTFRIELPMAEAMTTVVPVASPEHLRVWLIDDDDGLRQVLSAALRKGGCEVSEAASGREAIQLVAQMTQPPHVLVCDHHMPDIDGGSLLRNLRHDLHEVPAILISAWLESDGSNGTPEDPFSERLPKPFAPAALLARVNAATRRHHVDMDQRTSSR